MLVSGYADLDSAISAINRVGVDRLLTKPWNSNELVGAVRAAAEHARLVRENKEMTEALHRKNQELLEINQQLDRLVLERTDNLLNGLVSALDLRDSETQWHSRRVGLYARRLAQELGVTGDELDDIERGATLHDIGKIGVRDAVLLKPGPLDTEEWREMKRHPALGYEILEEHQVPGGGPADPPAPPGTLGRHRVPLGAGRRADLPGRPHLRRGRHLRRHHQRPALPGRANLRRRPGGDPQATPARSSIPAWSPPGRRSPPRNGPGYAGSWKRAAKARRPTSGAGYAGIWPAPAWPPG